MSTWGLLGLVVGLIVGIPVGAFLLGWLIGRACESAIGRHFGW